MMIKENQPDIEHHEKKHNTKQVSKESYKMSHRDWKEVMGTNMQTLRRGKGGAMRRY